MQNLSFLSVECLRDITTHLSGEDITYLWFCGNAALNRKLADGGVSNFTVYLHPSRTFGCPSLVASLPKLRDFCLHTNTFYRPRDFDWQKLPSTLYMLDVKFYEASMSFMDAHTTSLRHFTNLHTLRLGGGSADLINPLLNELPNLTELSQDVTFLYLESLPRGLVSFSSTTLEIRDFLWNAHGDAAVDAVPSFDGIASSSEQGANLTDVEGRTRSRTPFPPGLMSLSLQTWDQPLAEWIDKLPSGLTSLSASGDNSHEETEIENWDYFPTGLRSLSFNPSEVSPKQVSQLPSDLTELSFSEGCTLRLEDDPVEFLKALPRHLTSLEMFKLNWTREYAKELPRALFRIFPTPEFAPEVFPFLPASLRQYLVKCPTIARHPQELIPINFTPTPQVRKISLIWPSSATLLNLPQGLTELTLTTPIPPKPWVHALPKTLRTLIALRGSPVQTFAEYAKLPESLLSLQAAASSSILQPSDADSFILPRQLTDLRLSEVVIQSTEWFRGLPSSLTRFKFSGSPPKSQQQLDLAFPGSLENFRLKDAFSILSTTCPHLDALEFLMMSPCHIDITDMFFVLPKRLSLLRVLLNPLVKTQLSMVDLSQLPLGLSRLECSVPLDSSTPFEPSVLPPYLEYLVLDQLRR